MKKGKAVVLLSGGQDSTTCLFWALPRFESCIALSIYYGQRHARELEAARAIAKLANVEHVEIMVPQFGLIADSALTDPIDRRGITPDGGFVDAANGPRGLPNTFVPGRNALFLTIAATLAVTRRCEVIVTGVCETDYSGYPDCRNSFIAAMENALTHAMPSNHPVRISTPLMYLDKRGTVLLASSLGPTCWEALSLSLTCYEGARPACGKCPACQLREKGFAAAGIVDPATARWTKAEQ